MATSVYFDLTDALVSTFTTALGSSAVVFDGVGTTDDMPQNFVMVGIGDPNDENPQQAADSQQDWHGLGARARDEVGTITCCAVAWNGEAEGLAACRAALKATTETIAAALKASPDLGGAVPGLQWTGFGARSTWTPIQAEDGSSLVHYFEIAYKARLI